MIAWTWVGLTPQPGLNGYRQVQLTLSSTVLDGHDYLIRLSGVGKRHTVPVATYFVQFEH
jgi:hypothetical protein